jgi:hypothetical protein
MAEGKFLLKAIRVLMMVFGLIAAANAILYLSQPKDVGIRTGANVLPLITGCSSLYSASSASGAATAEAIPASLPSPGAWVSCWR